MKRVTILSGLVLWTAAVFIFLYLMLFGHTGVDRSAYEQGHEVQTLGLGYFGKIVLGGGTYPLPERLALVTNDGQVLPPEEMVKYLNPQLKAFVKNGKIYTRTPEISEWGVKVIWLPANSITTNIAKVTHFIQSGKGPLF